MIAFAMLIHTVISLYSIVLLTYAVLSWLIGFNIVNPHQSFVRGLAELTARLCEPALNPIRKVVPSLGGVDISPVILLLLLQFIGNLLTRDLMMGY